MKPRYITLFLVLGYFLFFNGCASTLKLERDGPKLAEIGGIDPSEVKFIDYCSFGETTRAAEI
jgi:hypothetical protein